MFFVSPLFRYLGPSVAVLLFAQLATRPTGSRAMVATAIAQASRFALMLSLLPVSAALIGFAVLQQTPSVVELGALTLVIAGVALHRVEA